MVSTRLMINMAFTQDLRYPCIMIATLRLDRNAMRTPYYREAVEIG